MLHLRSIRLLCILTKAIGIQAIVTVFFRTGRKWCELKVGRCVCVHACARARVCVLCVCVCARVGAVMRAHVCVVCEVRSDNNNV